MAPLFWQVSRAIMLIFTVFVVFMIMIFEYHRFSLGKAVVLKDCSTELCRDVPGPRYVNNMSILYLEHVRRETFCLTTY